MSFRAKVEKPAEPIKQNKDSDSVDCLVVSCAELVGMFEKDFGLKVEESFLEEAAIHSVKKSYQMAKEGKSSLFKFIFVDLDDPTLMLGRFMESLNTLFNEN